MFYDAQKFEFVQDLEANWQTIKQELSHLQQQDFVAWPEKYLYGQGWDTFILFALSIKVHKNCDTCPETTRLISAIPNLVSASFSSLAPGTHIEPHTGYPDGLLRCHLGLTIPSNCGIRVGDDIRTWQDGKCMVFDDTVEHEAWNQSEQTRVVLLLDFKPEFSILEKSKEPSKGLLSSVMGLFKKRPQK